MYGTKLPNQWAQSIFEGKAKIEDAPKEWEDLINYWLGQLYGKKIINNPYNMDLRDIKKDLKELPKHLQKGAIEAAQLLWHRNKSPAWHKALRKRQQEELNRSRRMM